MKDSPITSWLRSYVQSDNILFKALALWADAFFKLKFLEIRNPWGKVMERRGLRYEHFCLKIV